MPPPLEGLAEFADRLLLPPKISDHSIAAFCSDVETCDPKGRVSIDDNKQLSRRRRWKMDLLHDQVNDLKYLSQNAINPLAETATFTPQSAAVSPVSAVGHNSAHHQHHHQQHHPQQSASSSDHNNYGSSATTPAGSKRKDVDDGSGSKQQRSKRNRYISIAW